MKKLFAIISLFALVLTSCEKEETIVIGSNFDTITATIESAADTKATLQTSGTSPEVPVYWKTYDKISVFFQDGGEYKNVLYILNSGENSKDGIFEKSTNVPLGENATIVAAVYPYNANATYTNGIISVPATEIKGQTGIIDAGPMAAKANGTSNSLEFKNAGAYVRVDVSDIPLDYTSVELSSETSNLTGAYSLEFNSNGIPTATLIGNTKIITYSDNSGIGSTSIYFPVFAGTYSDLKVTAKGTGKPDITLIAPKALTAVRNTIHYISRAVNTTTNNLVELETNNGQDLNIIIDSDAETITVTEDNGATVTGNVNIFIDKGAIPPGQERHLVINLPSATVLLNGNTDYTSITSTTASNTLILCKGVTAQKVTVNQGNVQVNEEATVTLFVNDSAEDIVIIDNGGTIPAENTGFIERKYAEHELIKAINDNTVNTHTLTGNVTLSEILTINRDFVLDGNGYTLTSTISGSTGRAINVGKSGSGDLNVTIKNLTIETSGQRAINLIQGSHNVTIENVTATSDNYTVNVAASAPGSTVTINNSTLTGKNTINIGGNNTTMTVSESTLTTIDNNADEGYSTITVGSYDVGSSDFLSGSEVSVQNCTFNINGDDTNYTYNVSYASSLNEVEIISSNPAQLSIEDVKAILLQSNEYYYSASTLDELIENANGGNIIILVGNVTETQNITCNKNLTLDLNEYTMTIDTDADQGEWGLIFEGNTTIKNGKIVTKSRYPLLFNNETNTIEVTITDIVIEGNRNEGTNGNVGTIIMGGNARVTIEDVNISANNYSCIIEGTSNDAMSNYAEININGGNFSLINKSSDQATVLGAGFGSTINVNNGVFDGTEANFVASAYPSGGIINIGNGTFKGELKEYTSNGKTVEISIKGGTFTVNPSDYLLNGYSATENNGIWTVSATEN